MRIEQTAKKRKPLHSHSQIITVAESTAITVVLSCYPFGSFLEDFEN
jgi:hypothetical protein